MSVITFLQSTKLVRLSEEIERRLTKSGTMESLSQALIQGPAYLAGQHVCLVAMGKVLHIPMQGGVIMNDINFFDAMLLGDTCCRHHILE